ncbi:hypothetical protein [Nguyenibacter sp. L1]|uniref:hypothetical protein n=1 Tax=Nguyenibacter sp. L1 TaxID=3049350 RepID=UPI002B4912A0|nr:hypothetical protein [Nguyenibacter sp. L1]WRH86338.1 hypothetical protein QN315_09705 [Nguyenibacter sp. L1]
MSVTNLIKQIAVAGDRPKVGNFLVITGSLGEFRQIDGLHAEDWLTGVAKGRN